MAETETKVITLEKKTITSKLGGHEWGWLSPEGVLFTVPNSGGHHEVVAKRICKQLNIADSVTMEKMGWIRIDGADVRTCHCPTLGCMTQAQHKFLSRALAALAVPERGSSNDRHRQEFRALLAHATIRQLTDKCAGQGGQLVAREVKGKKIAYFVWDGDEGISG